MGSIRKASVKTTIKLTAEEAAKVTARAGAKGVGKIAIKSSELIFSAEKIVPQMAERGWTKESVKALIDNPYTTRVATNKALNNPATVFYAKDGTHVVVDDLTKQVVQVTDNAQVLKGQWYPDNSIINPYKP